MADLIEKLPVAPPGKPEDWSPPELLINTAREGLLKLHAILTQPIRLKQSADERLDPEDLKLQRLVGDLALGVDKLLARVGEANLRQQNSGKWQELLDNIKKFKAEEAAKIGS